MLDRTVTLFVSVFLLSNLAVRLYALQGHGVALKLLLPVLGAMFLIVRACPGIITVCFFLFGLSLPLYGFQSYTLYNQVFEVLLVCLGGFLFLSARGESHERLLTSGRVGGLLGCYILLVLCSLLLLPISSFVDKLTLWGILDFWNALLPATPENPLYSVAAANRLVLFVFFILLLNRNSAVDSLYRVLILGCACSVLVTCLLGLLNHYGIISLEWYRPDFLDVSGISRLHSVLGNPGWFAEYILTCSPFILFVIGSKAGLTTRFIILSFAFIMIGASLLLTGSRTSWLIFPIVTPLCYFILLLSRGNQGLAITWKELRLSCIQAGLGGLFVCLIAGSVLMVTGRNHSTGDQGVSLSREEYILQRIRNITNPSERSKLWQESLVLVGESPVYGMGYEGYRWHQDVMSTIPDSRFSQQRQTSTNWDTAHNFYIQLVVSNGIIGLLIWIGLTGYVALLLFRDAMRNRNAQSFGLLGALVVFHLYGFTQSMQYVASIWFLVFVIIGYAMRLDQEIRSPGVIKVGRYGVVAALIAAVSGGIVYGANLQSHQLADRYGLSLYGLDQNGDEYKGFYQKENWGKDGYFRWTGRAAEIVLRNSGIVQFDFSCYAPRLEQLPLTFAVLLDGRLIDQHTFLQGQKIRRTYFIPVDSECHHPTLHFQVSRIWNPKREKLNSDTRNLGIAVSEPRYLSMLPVISVLLMEKKKGTVQWH